MSPTVKDVVLDVSTKGTSAAAAAIEELRAKFKSLGDDIRSAGGNPTGPTSMDGGAFQREISAAKETINKRTDSLDQEADALHETASASNAASLSIWGLTAALKLYLLTAKETEENLHRMRQQEIADVQSVAKRRIADSQATSMTWERHAATRTNLESFRVLRNRPADIGLESEMRSMESQTDITPGRKAELRSRAETNLHQEQQRKSLQDEVSFIGTKQFDLEQAKQEALKRRSIIEESGPSRLRTIRHQVDESMNAPGAVFGFRTKSQNTNTENLQLEYKKQEVQIAKELKDVAEEIASIDAQQVGLATKKRDALGEQYKVTKQQQQDAYVALRDQKEGMRQDAVGFGMSSFGDQARMKMVDAKISRIKAQKASGQTTEQLLPWEMQIAKSHGFGTTVVDEQAKAKHDAGGLENWDRTAEQLAEKQKDFDEKMAAPTEGNLVSQMGDAVEQAKKAVADASKAVVTVGEIAKMVNDFQAQLEAVEEAIKTSQQQRGQTLQPWF